MIKGRLCLFAETLILIEHNQMLEAQINITAPASHCTEIVVVLYYL